MNACFFCLHAYPLFDRTIDRTIGGMETRAWLFARGLAQRTDYQVSFVVGPRDEGEVGTLHHVGTKDTIELFEYVPAPLPLWEVNLQMMIERLDRWSTDATFSKWSSVEFPWIRWDGLKFTMAWQLPIRIVNFAVRILYDGIHPIKPNWHPKPVRRFRKLPAAVFCTFGVNHLSAEVIASAKRFRRASVLLLASDIDLSEMFCTGSQHECRPDGVRADVGRKVLSQADHIVAQSDHQLRLLKERFGRDGVLIRNPVDLDLTRNVPAVYRSKRDCMLWIGRSDTFHKRPSLLTELARRCPDIEFLMVMNEYDSDTHESIVGSLPPNVKLIESVPYRDMPSYFCRAKALISTSSRDYEGFPNVFLQAGACGTAVVSLEVDPDEIFSKHRCGVVCGSELEMLVREVRRVWSDEAYRIDLADRLGTYVRSQHDYEQRLEELSQLIERVGPAQNDTTGLKP